MAHILIVAATPFEIKPLLDKYAIVVTGEGIFDTFLGESHRLSVLISGVGMVNTAFAMGRYSNSLFDAVINAGIAGAYNKDLLIGDVVNVIEDELSEMGAENGDEFIKYEELNLGGTNAYKNIWLLNSESVNSLRKVKGITVNKVHGNEKSISSMLALFNPDTESMEGAAFFAGCKRLDNYIQIRAISNYVERRNKNNWNIPLAIKNLNDVLLKIIEEIYNAH